MIIYNPDDTVLLNIEVDDTSAAYAEVMNRNDVTLEFSLAEHVEIPLGAYVEFGGRTYQLLVHATTTVVNRRYFQYTAVFETDEGKMRLWRVHNLVDGRLKFSLTARPSEHLAMFVGNLNEREGATVWAIAQGSYDSEEITISYNQTTIRDAMNELADQCETEWEVFKSGDTIYISLGKVEYNKEEPIALSYGDEGGFESGVKRTNNNDGLPIQVLYVQGGDRNIDASTYYNRSHNLLLPRSYSFNFDGEKFEGETDYDATKAVAMVTDADGYSVKLTSAPRGAAEESLDLSDIYPKRVGTISAVQTVASGGDYPFYNITDGDLGTGAGKVNINFNDLMIEGEDFTIVFQSGMLTGREIGVHKFTLNSSNGVFELAQETIDGFIMPGEGGYVPAVGDTYAVFGCALPSAYIADATTHSGAEFEMLRKAAKYVYENKDARQSFKGVLSPVFARKNWTTLGPKIVLGGYVSFTDEDVQEDAVLMRIMAVKTYINKPYKPEIELSNEATKGTVGGSIQHLSNNFAHTDRQFYDERGYTNRRWRDAKEGQSLLEQAIETLGDEFSEGINPVTIHTMSALVGSTNLQYEVYTSNNYSSLVSDPFFDSSGNLFCRNGYVKHYTLGFSESDYVKSARPNTEYYRWKITGSGVYTELFFAGDGPYYIYIAATKMSSASEGTATYLASRTPIPFEPTSSGPNYDTSHWYLLYATVSSKIEGSRSVVTYNGFTEITPGMIRAMKFISNDGYQYIDFISKAFRVGDADKFLAYNLNNDGELRLKGTLIQSPSGSTSPITCFRGAYSSSNDYYYGEEVTHEGQSWWHKGTAATGPNTTAGVVVPGTDASVWEITAAKGADGGSVLSADLENDTDGLAVGSDGKLSASVSGLGSKCHIYFGTEKQTISANGITPDDSLIPSSVKSAFTISASGAGTNEGTLSVAITASASSQVDFSSIDHIQIPVTLTCTKGSMTVVYSLAIIKDGEDGTTYVLQPDYNTVKGTRASDNTITYTPTGVRCYRKMRKGNGALDNSTYGTLKYLSSLDQGTKVYSNYTDGTEVTVAAMLTAGFDYFEFVWYATDGTTVVDREVIPIVVDGANGADGASGSDGKTMRGLSEWSTSGFAGTGSYMGKEDVTGDYYDVVLDPYDNLYYLCVHRVDPNSGSTPVYATTLAPHSNPGCWSLMNNFENIATKALAVAEAFINKLSVNQLLTSGKKIRIEGNMMSVEDKVNIHSGSLSSASGGSTITKPATQSSVEGEVGDSTVQLSLIGNDTITSGANNKITFPAVTVTGSISPSVAYLSSHTFTLNAYAVSGTAYVQLFPTMVVTGASLSTTIASFTTSLSAGTWQIIYELSVDNLSEMDRQKLTLGTSMGSVLTVEYPPASTVTEIAGNGFRTLWGGNGLEATSNGSKVYQGGDPFTLVGGGALNSLTALKRIVLCTAFPSSGAEDGVLYIKVAASS